MSWFSHTLDFEQCTSKMADFRSRTIPLTYEGGLKLILLDEKKKTAKRKRQAGKGKTRQTGTGVKTVFCSICSKGFARPSTLRRHLETIHADEDSPSIENDDSEKQSGRGTAVPLDFPDQDEVKGANHKKNRK